MGHLMNFDGSLDLCKSEKRPNRRDSRDVPGIILGCFGHVRNFFFMIRSALAVTMYPTRVKKSKYLLMLLIQLGAEGVDNPPRCDGVLSEDQGGYPGRGAARR